MIAIDTNIVLRFLTRVPEAQFKDACVLAFSHSAAEIITFDRQFSKRAAKLGLLPAVKQA